MNRAVRSRLLLTAFAAGLFAACTMAQAPAQPADSELAIRHGTHVFRRIIHDILSDHDLTPLRRLDDLAVFPEKTLLVMFGSGRVQASLPMGVDAFVERGGAVLLASDRKGGLPQV